VAVEVKRKRTYAPGVGGKMTEVPTDKDIALATAELSAEDRAHLSNLTAGERGDALERCWKKPSATTRFAASRRPKRPSAVPPKEAELAAAEEARRRAAEARG